MPTSDTHETKPLTFAAALDTVEVTPGEASGVLYAWAANFHDIAPDLAAKFRKAGDNLAYGPSADTAETDSHDTPTTRRRVTAE